MDSTDTDYLNSNKLRDGIVNLARNSYLEMLGVDRRRIPFKRCLLICDAVSIFIRDYMSPLDNRQLLILYRSQYTKTFMKNVSISNMKRGKYIDLNSCRSEVEHMFELLSYDFQITKVESEPYPDPDSDIISS